MTAFPLRFRLGYISSSEERVYQAEGMMGDKPVLYVPAPESVLQPSEMGTLFLVSWARTLEEHPEYNVVGVILHHELRPIVEIEKQQAEIVPPVEKRIAVILKPAQTKHAVRTNHRARQKSADASCKNGSNKKAKA